MPDKTQEQIDEDKRGILRLRQANRKAGRPENFSDKLAVKVPGVSFCPPGPLPPASDTPQLVAAMDVCDDESAPQTVTRPIGLKVMYVLHLFAGDRRAGDLQDEFEKLCPPSSSSVFVISLDIANDKVRGDISREDTISFWRAAMQQGRIAGLWAGPPRGTWCRARPGSTASGHGTPPRPVRDPSGLWGMGDLSARECLRVEVGNLLLRTTIYFLHVAYLLHIPGILALPAPPPLPDVLSPWDLPELSYLRGRPRVREVRVDLCMWGAAIRNPTLLLAVHADSLFWGVQGSRGRGLCCHGSRAHEASLGMEEEGNFPTSRTKAYPPGLCALAGRVFLQEFLVRWPHLSSDDRSFVEHDMMPFWLPLDPYLDAAGGSDCER